MHEDTPNANLARIRQAIVHERHGIISSLFEQNGCSEAPELFVFNAITANCNYFRRNAPHRAKPMSAGSGAAFDRGSALMATFGEVFERYAASIYDPDSLVRSSAEELGDRAVDLDEFVFFAPDQYAEAGFRFAARDKQAQYYWTPAIDLTTGDEKLVPATLVYLGADIEDKSEEIFQPSSTGLAAGPTAEFAAIRALCEMLERDAFGSMWLLGYSPPKLIVGEMTRSRMEPALLSVLDNGPLRIHLWSLVTDIGLPVVLAMAESLADGVLTIGASANPDPALAIEKAVVEALHGFLWGRHKLGAGETVADDQDFFDPQSHLAFYLDPRRRHHLDFLFRNSEQVNSDDIAHGPTTTAGVASQVAEAGYRVLLADLTTEDMHALGIQVVRAIVPGLQPLLFGKHLYTADDRRLRRLARLWGMPSEIKFNLAPHPFP